MGTPLTTLYGKLQCKEAQGLFKQLPFHPHALGCFALSVVCFLSTRDAALIKVSAFIKPQHARSFNRGLLPNENCQRHAACRRPCGGVYSAPLTR
jgi:hypothetical protein